MIVNPDGVDQSVCFFDQGLDLAFGVTAVVVTTIRDDEQRLLWVFRLVHFADAEVNGIQQSRPALWHCVHQLTLDIFDGRGEVRHLLRLVRESNHEEFILRIGGLEEFDDCLPGALNLTAHAAAHVEDHANRNRSILAGKCADFLRFLILVYLEIFLVESGYQAIHRIGNGDRHQHQADIDLHGLGVGFQRRVDALGKGVFCRLDARRYMNVIDRNLGPPTR